MKKRIISVVCLLIIAIACISTIIISNINKKKFHQDNEVPYAYTDLEMSYYNWKENHPKVHGIYVTGPTAGTDRMDELIELINNSDLNAIVLDVKDDAGNISFHIDNEDTDATDACIPYIQDIDSLLTELKDNDIYVIARIACFKDPTLAAARPDLALMTNTGEPVTDSNGNAWVNPCNKEVWDYITSIAESCCALGFDEIQLDYVRFPVGTNADQADYGVSVSDEERQDYINDFLSQISREVQNRNTPISADIFGTIIKSQQDAAHVGQVYATLATNLDCLSPMIYPSHYAAGEFGIEVPDAEPYETIYEALMGSQNALSDIPSYNCAVIRPWLQAFTADWVEGYIDYDADAILDEISAVNDSGYDEWILWNSESDYSVIESSDLTQ